MHRILEADLLLLDTKIERTLRNLRKITSIESRSMANQREKLQAIPEEEEEIERPQRQITMEDFWRPSIKDEYSAVRQLAIEENNFELKPALITIEDPNEHMGRFMRMANTIKLNGVKP